MYAPEPYDVGRLLQAEIFLDDQKMTVTTTGPIDPGWINLPCYIHIWPMMELCFSKKFYSLSVN